MKRARKTGEIPTSAGSERCQSSARGVPHPDTPSLISRREIAKFNLTPLSTDACNRS